MSRTHSRPGPAEEARRRQPTVGDGRRSRAAEAAGGPEEDEDGQAAGSADERASGAVRAGPLEARLSGGSLQVLLHPSDPPGEGLGAEALPQPVDVDRERERRQPGRVDDVEG